MHPYANPITLKITTNQSISVINITYDNMRYDVILM